MPTNKVPARNPSAHLLGDAEFSFSENSDTLAEALLNGYIDIGNVKAYQIQSEITKAEHKASYRGQRRTNAVRVTETTIKFQITADQWDVDTMRILLGAGSSSDFTQSALTAEDCDELAFSATTPSDSRKWYDLRVSNIIIREITAVAITGKVEGTDFEVDYTLGRIRFLVEQTASVTVAVTADEITAGDVDGFKSITPLSDVEKSGIGRLTIFDEDPDNVVVMDFEGFTCDLSIESTDEVLDDFAGMTLVVTVKDLVGTVYVREHEKISRTQT